MRWDNLTVENEKEAALPGFKEPAVVRTFDYRPNRAVVFVKTYNSWHSIRPMTGPDPKALRRTLTVVIEDQE